MVSSRAIGLLNSGRVCGDGAVENSSKLLTRPGGGPKLGRVANVARFASFGWRANKILSSWRRLEERPVVTMVETGMREHLETGSERLSRACCALWLIWWMYRVDIPSTRRLDPERVLTVSKDILDWNRDLRTVPLFSKDNL